MQSVTIIECIAHSPLFSSSNAKAVTKDLFEDILDDNDPLNITPAQPAKVTHVR